MLTATRTVYAKADGTPVFEETEGVLPEGAARLLVRKGSPIAPDLAEVLEMTPKRADTPTTHLTTLELIARDARRKDMTANEIKADDEASALHAAAVRRRADRESLLSAPLAHQGRAATLIDARGQTGDTPNAQNTQGDTEGLTTSHPAAPSAEMRGGERTRGEIGGQAGTGAAADTSPEPPASPGVLPDPAPKAGTSATDAARGAQSGASGSLADLDRDGRDEAGVEGTKKALTAPPPATRPTAPPPPATPPPAVPPKTDEPNK